LFDPYLALLSDDRRKAIMREVRMADTAMQVAGALDTWLPFATNVVEDIYVNRRLFQYRLGVEVPMRVHSRRVFEHGIEEASTGNLSQWRDNDKDAQAIISAYLVGQNLTEFASYLDPACDLTGDPIVQELVGSIPADCDIEERFEIAAKLLLHLRTLGFCPPPSDSVFTPPPPPNQPQGQSPAQPSPPQGAQPGQPEPGQGESDEGGEDEEQEGSEGSDGDTDEDGKTGKAGQAGTDGDDDEQEPGEGDGESDDEDEGDGAASGSGGTEESDGDDPDEEGDGEGDQGQDQDGSEGGQETNKASQSEPDQGEPEPYQPPTDAEIEEAARRAKELLTHIMGHEDSGPTSTGGQGPQDRMVLERVLKQEGFDHPSEAVGHFDLVTRDREPWASHLGRAKRVEVPRHMLTPSLARLRVVFASNRKTGIERSLRSGSRLDTMHLYRAGTDDPRIFGKRNVPKSRDWFVLVGLDFSSSTASNGADYAEKMAGHAIGDLLHQLGIRFSMYAHTAGSDFYSRSLEHVVIKAPDENWKSKGVQETLFAQKGRSTNLDGHSLEQYRKLILQERATDKMLMYFTDGEMPCANFNEELDLLKENIAILRRHRVHLVGCGYRTDSPKRHGLDTIQYDDPSDVASIVKGLEERLLQR
jgi:hypothetical protein